MIAQATAQECEMREGTVADIPDEELLRRAVMMARNPKAFVQGKQPRCIGVMHAFMLGSTYSAQLCRRFGLDPDEMVGR